MTRYTIIYDLHEDGDIEFGATVDADTFEEVQTIIESLKEIGNASNIEVRQNPFDDDEI